MNSKFQFESQLMMPIPYFFVLSLIFATMTNNDMENIETDIRMPDIVKPPPPRNQWGILLTFSMFAFVTQIGYVHLPSIVNSAAAYYSCTPEQIMTFSNIFPLLSFILGWLPLVVLRLRFDVTVILCSLVCTVGFWILYAAMNSYNIALLGHFFLSLSNVFALSPAIYIAEQYFPIEKRALAMSVPYYFCLFGTNFGYLCSTSMVSMFQIKHINLVYASIGTLQFALCVYSTRWVANQASLRKEDNGNRYSLRKELMTLRRKPSAFWSTLILSVFNGIGSAITTLIAFMFMTTDTDETFSDIQIGIAALVYNSAGAVFGITVSKLIEKKANEYQRQKAIQNFFKLLYLLSSLSSVAFAAYCNYLPIKFWSLCLILFFLGGSLNGSYSVIIEFITRQYGLSELLVSNLFNMSSSLISYIVIVYMSTRRTARVGTCLLAFVIMLCSLYLKLLYFKGPRSNEEEKTPNLTEQHQQNIEADFPPKSSMIQVEQNNKL